MIQSSLSELDLISSLIFIGFSTTGLLLFLALLLKISGGLFWSRPPARFKSDRENPKYTTERRVGKAFSRFTLKYISPFFLGFSLLLLWQLFFR